MPRKSALTELKEELAQLKEELRELRVSRRERLMAQSQDPKFKEHPDPTPVELPAGSSRTDSMRAMVQQAIRRELSAWAGEHELGTFEEEDDFEPEDEELLPLTQYDVHELEVTDEIGELDPAPPSFRGEPSRAGQARPEEPPEGGSPSSEGASKTEAIPVQTEAQ